MGKDGGDNDRGGGDSEAAEAGAVWLCRPCKARQATFTEQSSREVSL